MVHIFRIILMPSWTTAIERDEGEGVGPMGNGELPLVLIVDDDPDLRDLAEKQLSPHGFEVMQASDGKSCIEMAVMHMPDVILLDMMMPGMDGSSVLNELSNNPRTRDIPVIFLSGLATTEDRIKGLQGGALDWITKSTDPRELIARVGVAARTKARQEEIMLQSGADPITHLQGREAFQRRLTQEISRSSRSSAPLALFLVDIDSAPEIVDAHGSSVGDALMKEVASVLAGTIRVHDVLFRSGTHEFAVVLPDTEVSTAFMAAERCREEITSVEVAGEPVSVSVGVAQANPGRNADEVTARAEIALFRAKESGGGRSWRADDPRRHGLNPLSLAEELTDREWDVLFHLSQKRTEHEIARRLGITRGTVRSHKARIRRKLHVSPDVRLADFVRLNFKDLGHRGPTNAKAKS